MQISPFVILAGLGGAFFQALAVFLDKRWTMPNVDDTFTVSTFAHPLTIALLTPVLFATDIITVPSLKITLLSMATGVMYLVPLYLYFTALRHVSASEMTTVMRSSAVFTVIFAAILLNQTLTVEGYIGVALVILGASIVSISMDDIRSLSLSRGFGIALFSALGYGVMNLVVETVLAHISVWNFYYWSAVGAFSIILLCIAFRTDTREQFRDFASNPTDSGLIPLTTSKTIESLGALCFFWGTSLGKVAVVSSLFSVKPIFALFFAGLASVIATRSFEFDIRVVILELVPAILAVFGVWMLKW